MFYWTKVVVFIKCSVFLVGSSFFVWHVFNLAACFITITVKELRLNCTACFTEFLTPLRQ